MLPEYFEFRMPTKVIYGIGILKNIEGSVRSFGNRRAILVTDEVLAKTGPVDKVKNGFKHTNIKIVCTFDDVPPNSTIDSVEKCAAEAKKHKCNMLIAVGGGSDRLRPRLPRSCWLKAVTWLTIWALIFWSRMKKLDAHDLVPTTAGTGSEVTKVAVIADPDNDVKLPFSEEQFLPDMAILDPGSHRFHARKINRRYRHGCLNARH